MKYHITVNALHKMCPSVQPAILKPYQIYLFSLVLIPLCAIFLSSCATYKEPISGSVATLTCKQPPGSSAMTFSSEPISRVMAVDGKNLPVPFMSIQQSVKIPEGIRVISIWASDGPTQSRSSIKMNFRGGRKLHTPDVSGCWVSSLRGERLKR